MRRSHASMRTCTAKSKGVGRRLRKCRGYVSKEAVAKGLQLCEMHYLISLKKSRCPEGPEHRVPEHRVPGSGEAGEAGEPRESSRPEYKFQALLAELEEERRLHAVVRDSLERSTLELKQQSAKCKSVQEWQAVTEQLKQSNQQLDIIKSAHEAALAELRSQLEQARARIGADKSDELASLQKRVTDLLVKVEEGDVTLQTCTRKLAEAAVKANSMDGLINTLRLQNTKLSAQIEANLKKSEQEITAERSRVSGCQQQLDSLNAEIKSRDAKLADTETSHQEAKRLRAELEALQQAYAGLQKTATDASATHDELRSKLEACKAQVGMVISQAEDQKKRHSQETENLQLKHTADMKDRHQRLERQQQSIDRMKSKISESERNVANLQESLNACTSKHSELSDRVERAQVRGQRTTELEAQLGQLELRRAELERKLDLADAGYKKQLATKDSFIADQKQKIEHYAADQETLMTKMEEMEIALNARINQVNELTTKVSGLKGQLEECQEYETEEFTRVQEEVTRVQNELKDCEDANREFAALFKEKAAEIKVWEGRAGGEQAKATNISLAMIEMSAEFASCKTDLARANAKLEMLGKQFVTTSDRKTS